ncbi:hypothetical protein evm_000142 [Chilo suppressalis]|nr:hypothetical protein evm_000142 [Chilo suppressalis]
MCDFKDGSRGVHTTRVGQRRSNIQTTGCFPYAADTKMNTASMDERNRARMGYNITYRNTSYWGHTSGRITVAHGHLQTPGVSQMQCRTLRKEYALFLKVFGSYWSGNTAGDNIFHSFVVRGKKFRQKRTVVDSHVSK